MTTRASDLGVAPYERVSGRVGTVVEADAMRPGQRGVTLLTVCREAGSHMIDELTLSVIVRVASETFCRLGRVCTGQVVLMAALARQLLVCPAQWETGTRVDLQPLYQRNPIPATSDDSCFSLSAFKYTCPKPLRMFFEILRFIPKSLHEGSFNLNST